MTPIKELTTPSLHRHSLFKCMLVGAGIAILPITLFLLGVRDPNPAWSKFWMLRPMIMVPLAGAAGGVFYYIMDLLRYQGGWRKILADFMSLVVFIIGIWLGAVLGLAGTLWD